MNAPVIHREILKLHIAAVEEMYPITFVGRLPRGSVGSVRISDENALEFLCRKREGLTLFDLCGAENELGRRLGRTVGIVLESGLKGREAEEFPRLAEPL
ncbi:MAG TPA: hypothetical protein VIL72_02245 [Beijerinckiaceae bacterium]